jgi:hypothetical protein
MSRANKKNKDPIMVNAIYSVEGYTRMAKYVAPNETTMRKISAWFF